VLVLVDALNMFERIAVDLEMAASASLPLLDYDSYLSYCWSDAHSNHCHAGGPVPCMLQLLLSSFKYKRAIPIVERQSQQRSW
jgi:hypothetical protein